MEEKIIPTGLRITFYGGAETVTGSNFMIEGEKGKILVDCGIEQGRDFSEAEMYAPFPYDVASVDAVVVTHAHLDHVGRLPKLYKEGFKGKVYMTPPTRDLTELILKDSVHILAEEARQKQMQPLYLDEDVQKLLEHIETLDYHTEKEIASGLSVYLRNTGHILGSASVRIKDTEGNSLAITSDIGGSPTPLLPDHEAIDDAGTILIESVYGDRQNTEKENRVPELRELLKKAIARGGAIMIPTFSIERTQLMLYELSNMFENGELPRVPVFLDSPLAIAVTDVYRKYADKYFNDKAEEELHREKDLFNFPYLRATRSREDSEGIEKIPNPKIIIAGAGMSHGGRIGAHEVRYLPDPKSTLIMVGYQAPGSPGRILQGGGKKVFIAHREVTVRAQVESLSGWSGHADRDGLLAFAEKCLPNTKNFLVGIGEPASARFLAQRIHDFLGVKAIVPMKGETFSISKRYTNAYYEITDTSMENGMVTTAFVLDGYKVVKNFGVVRGIVVRSRSVIGQFGAGIQSFFGGNITLYEELCENARQQAYDRLLAHAKERGANAIIGVHYDATELDLGITEVLAYGTAVEVEKV